MTITGGQIFSAWLSVFFTLAIFSFLYKDNPLFKLAEHIFVGVSVGYGFSTYWHDIYKDKLFVPLWHVSSNTFFHGSYKLFPSDTFWLLVPLILGMMMLCQVIPKLSWISRYPLAFLYGTVAGIGIPNQVSGYLFKQIEPMIKPYPAFHAAFIRDSLIILLGVVCVLVYFFYSIEHKGPVKSLSKLGIYFLMVSFGAAFGYTVMARETLLIGRVEELNQFAGKPYYCATLILLGLLILYFLVFRSKGEKEESASSPPEAGL